jgi:hypothetical protein
MASSYYGVGARDAMWVPVVHVIAPAVIALMSIRYGVGGWGYLDRFCLLMAFCSSIPLLYQLPGFTLLCTIAVDVFGLLPTLYKTYKHTEQEDAAAWIFSFCANLLNVFAVGSLTLMHLSLPLYMFFATGTMVYLIFKPCRKESTRKIVD